ncbi:hypothetical protein [Actinomycetospora termitidis]|uniref:Uncharacterized protein n=1 Tax=Actinomycetospora termitidis TaxID=3053470 RepID=A0ABT7MFH3_9PSEU|nr:hypothetical protein [Actinomycetospora sp. Odt1-22]MDL5159428.1 hypothetical protein [Actinomycetospora sp. Odt1-22]
MGRHSRRRRSERAAARQERHARQQALVAEQQHQEELLGWKRARLAAIAGGASAREAQRIAGPMPQRRPARVHDDTPPTTPLNLAAMIPAPRREDQQ